jgi:hypothetical protein
VRDGADLPDWLPPLVAERARAILAAAVEAGTEPVIISEVKRLTTDPRMDRVWKYLQRKKRKGHQQTHNYEYPIRDLGSDGPFPPPFRTRAIWMQHLAMEIFYCDVLCLMTGGRINRLGGPYPTPPPFISQFRNPYRDRAEALRAEAKSISTVERKKVEGCPRELDRLQRLLQQTADAYEQVANASRTDSERRIPAVVTAQIAKDLEALFGRKMYGQAAAVASVILDRDVTAADARAWCRHKGWIKVHKKQP